MILPAIGYKPTNKRAYLSTIIIVGVVFGTKQTINGDRSRKDHTEERGDLKSKNTKTKT